jgi:drug/metabolite transporter (DMT)-like permease
LIAMFSLGEAIQAFHWIGGALVLLGVIVAQMPAWRKMIN